MKKMRKASKNYRLEKIVVNIGLGRGGEEKGLIESASQDLMQIAGQKPKVNKARVSIAEFNLRKGAPIGLTTTLRGRRMQAFLTKLFQVVLPRLRDFQGLSPKSFDGRGNYTLGISEQIVFPEIDAGKIDKTRGLEITLKTNAGSDEEGKKLLLGLGLPLEKEGNGN